MASDISNFQFQSDQGLFNPPDPGSPLYKLITDTPSFTGNPVGKVARNALVSKLEGVLPGDVSWGNVFNKHSSTFRKKFFPQYSPASYESNVSSVIPISWSDFSVAVLCQSIYHQATDVRNRVNISKVNSDVTTFNSSFQAKVVAWYSYVMFHDYMKYTGDRETAKNTYMEQLNSAHWVTYKVKQLNDGTWNNPDWDLHHWVKLSALGASDSEISSLMDSLVKL